MTRTRKVTLNVAALGTALLAVGGWAFRSTAAPALHAVNTHWVLADSFAVFQQGLREARITDSLNALAATKEIKHYLDSANKDLKSCIRHPEDCR